MSSDICCCADASDTTPDYLTRVLGDVSVGPPSYEELPAELPMLSEGLPFHPMERRWVLESAPGLKAKMEPLLSSVARVPAAALASATSAAVVRTFTGGGKGNVYSTSDFLVNHILRVALEQLEQTHRFVNSFEDDAGTTTGRQRPDVLLYIKHALLMKVCPFVAWHMRLAGAAHVRQMCASLHVILCWLAG